MIIFKQSLQQLIMQYSHNNSVFEFRSDNASAPASCVVNFFGKEFIFFPSPDGSFYINMKEFIRSIAGLNGYGDNQDIDIDSDGYLYDMTENSLLEGVLTLLIKFEDSGVFDEGAIFELSFLKALIQLEDKKRRFPLEYPKYAVIGLNPLHPYLNYTSYVKYFEGFPFDLTVYTGGSSSFILNNDDTGQIMNFTDVYKCSRVVISDGRTDTGLTETFILKEGINNISVRTPAGGQFNYKVDKKVKCTSGVYLKWRNSNGSFSYWLFHRGNTDRSVQGLGELNNDFNNIENTVSPFVNIGVNTSDSLQVVENVVSEEERTILESLIDSPAIFLFTGQPYDRNNYNDWMQIKMKNSSHRVANAKQKKTNFVFNFDLPNRQTITL